MRLLHRLAAAALACFGASILLAAPAPAEEGYTYWGYYFRADGDWQFSQKGPAQRTPKDGSVDAWHYATTPGTAVRPPRADLGFGDICAGTEAPADHKRVGVVLDYGTAADAPDGEEPPAPEALCAVVPTNANGAQVLEAVADVRIDQQLTCGINGYPATGCSIEVANAQVPESEETVEFTVPAAAEDDLAASAQGTGPESADDGLPWPLIGVGVLAVVLVVMGVFVARRRA